MRTVLTYILVLIVPLLSPPDGLAADIQVIETSKHRVVFETDLGHLVFAFYPGIAPRHTARITQLVESGAYDSTHFFRVIPGFIIQTSEITDRTRPMPAGVADKKVTIPAEFTTLLKHRAGILSMARMPDDPNSASSSFSIMLGNAPHLDGQYTIFGQLESGGKTINRILAIPRTGETPDRRINIKRAYTIEDINAYYSKHGKDPVNRLGVSRDYSEDGFASVLADYEKQFKLVVIMIITIILASLAGFVFYERISKARLLSLQLLNVLIGLFLLFILLTPRGHSNSWMATGIFVCLFLMFRLMSHFESRQK